jgi:hypothetical protein
MSASDVTVLYFGDGATPPSATEAAWPANWRDQDYAWTHSAPVEGFFTVLTIVIVPVAILRWTRHSSLFQHVMGAFRRRAGNF